MLCFVDDQTHRVYRKRTGVRELVMDLDVLSEVLAKQA